MKQDTRPERVLLPESRLHPDTLYPGHPGWFFTGVGLLAAAALSFTAIKGHTHNVPLAHYACAGVAELGLVCLIWRYIYDDYLRGLTTYIVWGFRVLTFLTAIPVGIALHGRGVPMQTCVYVAVGVMLASALWGMAHYFVHHHRELPDPE